MKKHRLLKKTSAVVVAAALCSGSVISGADARDGIKYYTDFATYEEEQAAAEALAAEIGAEGMVLLKNTANALPVAESCKNITLFGGGAYDTVYGGGGSGAGSANDYQTQKTIVGSLENAGFSVNPTVKSYYENLENYNISSSDDMWSSASSVRYANLVYEPDCMKSVEGSYTYYSDAAIIVISREGTEGADKDTRHFDNGRSGEDYAGTEYEGADSHSLELFPEELELIKHVKAQNFDKIIVMLNTSNAIEAATLEDDPDIDAIVWIGNPGAGGLEDLGALLRGEKNFSGRMVDVYDADHTQDPTWYNFGDNLQNGDDTGAGSIYYTNENGEITELAGAENMWGAASPRQQIEYEEGIYVGYKWYETAATVDGYYTADENSYAPGTERTVQDAYYNRTNGVVYPFGYGLSYTTFDWEILSSGEGALDAKTEVTIEVQVTNTGDYAGKDVVEVYYTAPYTEGGIEKSAVNLITYGKTKLLQPGESEVLTLSFNAKDMASFDWNDANGNDFKGYELEAGSYSVTLRTDSHTVKNDCEITYTVDTGIQYDGSEAKLNWNEEGEEDTGKANAEAVFSDAGSYYYTASPKGESASNVQYVTRADWKLPSAPTVETSILQQEDIDNIYYQETFTPADDSETDPWYVAEAGVPSGWTQATEAADKADTIQVQTLIGKDFDVKIVDGQVVQGDDEDTLAWEAFMNQFTLDELKSYLSLDWEINSIERAGIDKTSANDGPAKLLNGTYWPSCTLIASTWNVDLAYQQGRMTGNEGLFQNCYAWYGPGANIHRSPFGGRNFEYYSSDGIQGGMICAAVIRGATDMGIIPTLKHCALNDQETHRQDNQGLVVWCNEQAMREVYFKPFEMAATDGNGVAYMSSYTRYGTVGADNNYYFQNVIVRDEWGMDGMFYSDMGGADNADYHFRTGGTHGINAYTNAISGTWNENGYVEVDGVRSDTQWAAIRITAMQWMQTVVNSAANRNGVNTEAFTSKSGTQIDVIKGQEAAASIGATLEELNAYEQYYTVVEGTLPEGLTLNEDGTITGVAEQEGSAAITVALTADRYVTTVSRVNTRNDASTGYYSTDADFIINVVSAFQFGNEEWKSGEYGEAQISSDIVVAGEDNIASVTYSMSDAPEWLNISEDGAVYGTPDAAGEYSFTVQITATEAEDENAGFFAAAPASTVYTETYTISVAE